MVLNLKFMKATLCHKSHFNAAFRHHNPNWSEAKNKGVFGDIEGEPIFEGHNYNLEIKLFGEIEPTTGQVFDKEKLAYLVKTQIEKRYDHQNLYLDIDDFKDTVPTVEMMAVKIWYILRPLINQQIELKVLVHESHQNYAIYEGN